MGYLYIKEEEPPLNVSPEEFTKNMHTLNFTVIGTDSALFKSAVHDVEMFNLAVAERIQILIKYDEVP
jgi:FtsP/CotA-like multicopper oxidase with cupredoxin domain